MIAIVLTLLAAESGGSGLLMEYLPKISGCALISTL